MGKAMRRREFLKKTVWASAALAGGPTLMETLEACGGGTASNPNPSATVNFAGGGEIHIMQWTHFVPEADAKFKELVSRWASQHSGWKVVVDIVASNDLQTKTSAAVLANAGPDIIQMEYNWPWLYQSACVDVSDVANRVQGKVGKFYDSIANQAIVKGKFLAVPWAYTPNGWIFRKDLWSAVGKPAFVDNHDDMLKYGVQVKQASGKPIGEALGHAYGDATTMWYSTMWNFGGQEVQKDGKTVAINSKETEAALNWATQMWQQGLDQSGLAWDDSSNNKAYAAKTISATLNGASIYINMKPGHSLQDPDLLSRTSAAAPIKGPKAQSTIHLSFAHAVMRWTKNVGACKDLIEYLMQKDVWAEWLVAGGGYNGFVNGALDGHSIWSQDPILKQFNDAVKLARWPGWPGPPSKASSKVQTSYVVVDMFAKAVQDPSNIKRILSDTEGQLNSIYGVPG
jgi:multiple sugar transport system substrate-binding protein